MFEVFAIIETEEGTHSVPTGVGSVNRNVAENLMLSLMIEHPAVRFFVDYVPPEDAWNAW